MCRRPVQQATWHGTRHGSREHDRVVTGPRLRYLDLVRVVSIAAVVLGHWLLVDVTYRHHRLSGVDALDYVSWGGWVTLLLQVIPAFFLVGGYVNALSWSAHHHDGESWASWMHGRGMRLLWPTSLYIAVMSLVALVAAAAGATSRTLAQAGWLVGLHLWFLPVYLLLIGLTPALYAAHRRWGLLVPAVMVVAAAAVDVGVVGAHLPLIGFANYLLVWGSMHQCGFAWRDGLLTRSRWHPVALAGAGAGVLAVLVTVGPFPLDMVGTRGDVRNTSPPSLALLAFAAAQAGLVISLQPAASRLLARPRWWRAVGRLDAVVLTVYLWHMVPVVLVAATVYPTGAVPQPDVGSWQWWALRPAWLVVLAAVLVPVTIAATWLQRPLRRWRPGAPRRAPWTAVLVVSGSAAACVALARLAIAGFAPGGTPAVLVVSCYTAGFVLLLLATGRAVRT